MKAATSKTPNKIKAPVVCRTVSMAPDLLRNAEQKISNEPEMNFSKYVRSLIRADLEKSKAA